jgi:DNA polymerase III subunit delta
VAFGKTKRSEFLSYDDFAAEASGSRIGPLYLFIGKEDFLIDECIKRIIDVLVPSEMRGFNLDVMYGNKSEAKDVVAHASSYPMMGDRRVVIVKEFEKLALTDAAKEALVNYVQKPLESTCLVLVSGEPDFRKRPFTELKKTARIIACDQLYDNQVPAWIGGRVHSKRKEASPEACRMLQAYVGNSLRALDSEIDKLLIFIGDRKEITEEDIAAVVGASKGFTVFDLQNCIGKKDAKGALTVLARMMEAGENSQMIIVMLTRFFTTLLKIGELKQRRIPDSQFAAELKISPYFLKQYLEYYSNFSPSGLENAFRALLSADAKLKSSTGDPRIVMDLLVYSFNNNCVNEEALAS